MFLSHLLIYARMSAYVKRWPYNVLYTRSAHNSVGEPHVSSVQLPVKIISWWVNMADHARHFERFSKENRSVNNLNSPTVVGGTEIGSHQINKIILLIHGCCLICLLNSGSRNPSCLSSCCIWNSLTRRLMICALLLLSFRLLNRER
jgi:hypothetical protein